MALTLEEIKERMKRWDELTLIEELSIRSEDIVERFDDIIEEKVKIIMNRPKCPKCGKLPTYSTNMITCCNITCHNMETWEEYVKMYNFHISANPK